MNAFSKLTVIAAIGVAGWFAAAANGDAMIDDFESYADGDIIGASVTSSPWRRFGPATNDNVTASWQQRWVISGRASAAHGLVWPNLFGSVRYAFGRASDLSSYTGATVKVRSTHSQTRTRVRLAIGHGHTTFVTIVDKPVTTQAQTLTFELGQDQMTRTAGDDSYDNVIENASTLGLDFRSDASQYTETVIFDDLVLTGAPTALAHQETKDPTAKP